MGTQENGKLVARNGAMSSGPGPRLPFLPPKSSPQSWVLRSLRGSASISVQQLDGPNMVSQLFCGAGSTAEICPAPEVKNCMETDQL